MRASSLVFGRKGVWESSVAALVPAVGAAPAAPAAASPAAQFVHAGNPDLSVAAEVIALGNDPPMLLFDWLHSLLKAVPR